MLATSEAMVLTAANVQPVKLPMALAASTSFAPVGLQIASGSLRSASDLVSMSGNSALRAAPVDRALAGSPRKSRGGDGGAKVRVISVLVGVRETSASKPSADTSLRSRCRRRQKRVELLGRADLEPRSDSVHYVRLSSLDERSFAAQRCSRISTKAKSITADASVGASPATGD
jgi:hypothetical protein